MRGKLGISAIVATVLIILVTVAAVAIVWIGIVPMVNEKVSFDELEGRVSIVSSGGYTVYDAGEEIAIVQIKRDVDDGVMDRIRIIFSIRGSSVSSTVVAPASGGMKTYTFDLSGYGEPDSVSVAPIFLSESGVEREGGITSEVDLSEGLIVDASGVVYGLDRDYYSDGSCWSILESGASVGDGIYEIDPDGRGGNPAFNVSCDMTSDEGGWTLIASYVNGDFFNDCTDVTDYGDTCQSSCGEFNTSGSLNCDVQSEKDIQDSELDKLKLKYIIDGSFGDLSTYESGDFVSPAYYRLPFNEIMFSDNEDDFISYDFSNYTTDSMKGFYAAENTNHLELLIPYSRSSLDPAVINNCSNFDLAIMMADNDGGAVNYVSRKYAEWSPAFAGPGWDSKNNAVTCGFDDAMVKWGNRKLGGQHNELSQYILWFVR